MFSQRLPRECFCRIVAENVSIRLTFYRRGAGDRRSECAKAACSGETEDRLKPDRPKPGRRNDIELKPRRVELCAKKLRVAEEESVVERQSKIERADT